MCVCHREFPNRAQCHAAVHVPQMPLSINLVLLTLDIEIVISRLSFVTFDSNLSHFYIENLSEVASSTRLQSFSFFPFDFFFFVLGFSSQFQSALFSVCFFVFGCLLSLSSICSRNIRICYNKWLLDLKKRSTVRVYYLVALNCCLRQIDGQKRRKKTSE